MTTVKHNYTVTEPLILQYFLHYQYADYDRQFPNSSQKYTMYHFEVDIRLLYEQFLNNCFALVGHEVHPNSDKRLSESPDVSHSDVLT